jgi:hypothetical protein
MMVPALESIDWLDRSAEAIALARAGAARLPSAEHRFAVGDFREHLWPSAYDVIYALNSIVVPRGQLSGTLAMLLDGLREGGVLFIEISETMSTLHRLQLRAHQRITGVVGLEVGRSTDICERLVTLTAPYETFTAPESLLLGAMEPWSYDDLPPWGRQLLQWLNGGLPVQRELGQDLLELVKQYAEPSLTGHRIRSNVVLLSVGRPVDGIVPQAARSSSVMPDG